MAAKRGWAKDAETRLARVTVSTMIEALIPRTTDRTEGATAAGSPSVRIAIWNDPEKRRPKRGRANVSVGGFWSRPFFRRFDTTPTISVVTASWLWKSPRN